MEHTDSHCLLQGKDTPKYQPKEEMQWAESGRVPKCKAFIVLSIDL